MNCFNGVFTALVTPFDSKSQVDYKELKRLLDKQLNAKIDGVVINSTTGEGLNLNEKEKQKTANFVQKYVKNRAKIIISVGGCCYNNTISEIKNFSKINPDAFLLKLPFFIKPNFSGLVKYVAGCAKATNVPIILYYVPARSGQYLSADQLTILLNVSSNVVALKYADKNLDQLSKLAKLKTKTILCGEDDLLEECLKLGANGAISVASNAFPKQIVSFVLNFKNENSIAYKDFCGLKPIIKSLFLESNPILIKYLLNLLGFNVGKTRLPLDEPSLNSKNQIKEELFKIKHKINY